MYSWSAPWKSARAAATRSSNHPQPAFSPDAAPAFRHLRRFAVRRHAAGAGPSVLPLDRRDGAWPVRRLLAGYRPRPYRWLSPALHPPRLRDLHSDECDPGRDGIDGRPGPHAVLGGNAPPAPRIVRSRRRSAFAAAARRGRVRPPARLPARTFDLDD